MDNGATIVIKGEISASEDFVVTGRIEGQIQLNAGVLTLAPGSHVEADVEAPAIVIHGEIEGDIAATERLDVRADAVIRGNLKSPVLVVADGAQFNGRVEMPAKPATPLKFPVAV